MWFSGTVIWRCIDVVCVVIITVKTNTKLYKVVHPSYFVKINNELFKSLIIRKFGIFVVIFYLNIKMKCYVG